MAWSRVFPEKADMVARTFHCQAPEEDPNRKPHRFSEALVKKMAVHLEKRIGRPVSPGEADEALRSLTEFFRILLEHRKSSGRKPR